MDFEQQSLHLVSTVVPTSRACFYRVGRDLQPYAHVVLGGDNRWITPYVSEYRSIDPMHPKFFARREGSVFRIADSECDARDVERYIAGFQRRMGVRYKVELFLRDRLGGIIGGIRLSRAEGLGDFAGAELETLAAMQPVLCEGLQGWRTREALDEIERELTERERQVLRRILDGVSNKQISRDFGMALPTVKCHVRKILRKIGATSRGDIFARLYRLSAAPDSNPARVTAPAPRRIHG